MKKLGTEYSVSKRFESKTEARTNVLTKTDDFKIFHTMFVSELFYKRIKTNTIKETVVVLFLHVVDLTIFVLRVCRQYKMSTLRPRDNLIGYRLT